MGYKNSKEYVIQDIPLEYQGSPSLKWNTRIKRRNVSFHINIPSIVYVAYLAHYPNPFPDDFENTQKNLNVIQIEGNSPPSKKKFMAVKSGMFNIFKNHYPEGRINIPLRNNGLNMKGVPLLMWFKYDMSAGGPLTCGGNEVNVSASSGPHFDSCRTSSHFPFYLTHWDCRTGLNEKMEDFKGMWATLSQGVGAWMEVKFKGLYLLTRIEFQDRMNPIERNAKLRFTFDDGSNQDFYTRNVNERRTFFLEPIKTTTVRITILEVHGSFNNGGAFKIHGVKCINLGLKRESNNEAEQLLEKATGNTNPAYIKPLFGGSTPKAIQLRCYDTVSNSKKFAAINRSPGSKVLVFCPDTCSFTDFQVYGDLVYTADSAICKSAYHANKLQSEGGKVWLVFQPPKVGYRAELRNGIRSDGKSKSSASISFEGYIEEEEIIVEDGSKIDVLTPSGWLPGIIDQVDHKDSSYKVLTVSIEKTNKPKTQISYPDPSKIQPCGEKVEGRMCKGSRRFLANTKPIKFIFAPKDEEIEGDYVKDEGGIYGKEGKAFGWSRDMSTQIKQFNEASAFELHSFVEFFPAPSAKICSVKGKVCENVTWTAKTGPGQFLVRLYVGDPENKSYVSLAVNNKQFVQDKLLEEDKISIFENVVEAENEVITLRSNCKSNCDKGNSKINVIEIIPYKGETTKPKETMEKTLCGNGKLGGICDKGPDVLHCVYEDPSNPVALNCTGDYIIMAIPSTYICKDQVGKYKCVRKIYKTSEECKKSCVTNCNGAQCISENIISIISKNRII
jgi:hypothetical protein